MPLKNKAQPKHQKKERKKDQCFIGLANLDTDVEMFHQTMTLFELRFIIVNVLQLHPFRKVVETKLVMELADQRNEEEKDSPLRLERQSQIKAISVAERYQFVNLPQSEIDKMSKLQQ